MAQFIQYLYEYENGKKVRNLGFMKVEKQMDKSVIQIYAKQLDEIMGILFQREDGSKYLAAWEACEEDEAMCAEESRRDGGRMQAREQRRDEEMMQTREQRRDEEMMQARESRRDEEVMQEETSQREKEMPSQDAGTERVSTWENEEEDVNTYIPPNSRHCEKIQRQDMSRLPRRQSPLANNSI